MGSFEVLGLVAEHAKTTTGFAASLFDEESELAGEAELPLDPSNQWTAEVPLARLGHFGSSMTS
jgi:hypothetical protein